MLDGSSSTGAVVPTASFHHHHHHHHLNETNQMFAPQNSYHSAGPGGVVSPFPQHLTGHLQQHHSTGPSPGQQGHHPHNVATMGQSPHNCVLSQLPPALSNASQSLAALFASAPLISDDIKLAAAAAAAAAAAQSRSKKSHRAEPVPQSGFKGVSWNSRMKAWLAFYVTENGERKSKTFSTRKLGMEEARLQAIAFCKQKQEQRREARKRSRGIQNQQHCGAGIVGGPPNGGMDKLSSDESILKSPGTISPFTVAVQHRQEQQQQRNAALRCGYPTTPGMGVTTTPMMATASSGDSQGSNTSEIAYVPIVPIAMDMIEKSGLLQPLELNVLPPCQHCNKQPYPFLMIVSEGQEQTYSGSSIMSISSHNVTVNNNNGSPGSPSGGQLCNPATSASMLQDTGSVAAGDGLVPTQSSPNGRNSGSNDPLALLASVTPVTSRRTSEDRTRGPGGSLDPTGDQLRASDDTSRSNTIPGTTASSYEQDLLQVKLQENDVENSSGDHGSMMSGAPPNCYGNLRSSLHHVASILPSQRGAGGYGNGYTLNRDPTAQNFLSIGTTQVLDQQRSNMLHLDSISARSLLHMTGATSQTCNMDTSGASAHHCCGQENDVLQRDNDPTDGSSNTNSLMQPLTSFHLELSSAGSRRGVPSNNDASDTSQATMANGIMT